MTTLPALSPRQRLFVAEYLVDLNASRAAISAGYSARTAPSQASRLLKNVKVAAAIAAGQARRLERADLSADRVLEELRRLAFFDVRSLFGDDGNVRPISTLSAESASAVAGLEVIIKNAKAGDGVVDEVLKYRLADKTRALELLAKHFKLLVERIEVSDADKLVARLQAARRRAPEPTRG